MARTFSVVVIVLALALMAAAMGVRRDLTQTNDFFILFPVELLSVLLGGGVAAAYLRARRDAARGMLSVGLFVLIVAVAVSTVFPVWLPSDNTILGSALLAGELAAIGAGLALASAAAIAGRSAGVLAIAGLVSGILVFLVVTAGGVVYPLFQWRVPIVSAVLAAMGALAMVWSHRRWLVRPLTLALTGAVCTVAALLVRGPGDWASASTSVKLYSFPIVLMGLGISVALLDAVRPEPPP